NRHRGRLPVSKGRGEGSITTVRPSISEEIKGCHASPGCVAGLRAVSRSAFGVTLFPRSGSTTQPSAAAGTRWEESAVRISTKTGDDGNTGLLGSRRVAKDAPRVEVYGTVDELNATLGVARAQGLDPDADRLLAMLQDELFVVGSALADPSAQGPFHN